MHEQHKGQADAILQYTSVKRFCVTIKFTENQCTMYMQELAILLLYFIPLPLVTKSSLLFFHGVGQTSVPKSSLLACCEELANFCKKI